MKERQSARKKERKKVSPYAHQTRKVKSYNYYSRKKSIVQEPSSYFFLEQLTHLKSFIIPK